jgi:hypothetical protein
MTLLHSCAAVYVIKVDISVCPKVSEIKMTDISREEILANRARVEFNDMLVDIYSTGNFRFASICEIRH